MLKLFRYLALSEGVSFLAILLITMPLKYLAHLPQPNLYVGIIHGILFIAYVFMLIVVHTEVRFKKTEFGWLLLASIVPFGTFVADKKILAGYAKN